MIKVFSLVVGAAFVVSAARAEPVAYSIEWFAMSSHAAARQEAIRTCRNDYRFYDNKETRPICSNAETAESRAYSRKLAQGLNALNTVEWWRDNRDLRASALKACQRRAPYDRDMLQYCDVARQAEQDAMRRVRG